MTKSINEGAKIKFADNTMKVLDDNCICEFCPKPEEEKKECKFFLLATGLQRVAEAAMGDIQDFAIRIEMAECPLNARRSY